MSVKITIEIPKEKHELLALLLDGKVEQHVVNYLDRVAAKAARSRPAELTTADITSTINKITLERADPEPMEEMEDLLK